MKFIKREIELIKNILQERIAVSTNEIEVLEIAVILGKLEGELTAIKSINPENKAK